MARLAMRQGWHVAKTLSGATWEGNANMEIGLGEILIRVDAWFLGSLVRWGAISAFLTIAEIGVFTVACLTKSTQWSLNWCLFGWLMVVVNIMDRLWNQFHAIGPDSTSRDLIGAIFVLRLAVDALIIPSLGMIAVMIRRRSPLSALVGQWRYYALVGLVACTMALIYVVVRVSDWLHGSVGCIGIT